MNGRFVDGETVRIETVRGRLFEGLGDGPHPAVLVLHGDGGARGYEQTYATLVAEHGYTVLCVEYFGAPGVRDRLLEVPLEESGDAAQWRVSARTSPPGRTTARRFPTSQSTSTFTGPTASTRCSVSRNLTP